MKAVLFRWSAPFGHFQRAEAAGAGYGYPFPPRTAALGLLAAVLGFEKDRLATELADAKIALSGRIPAKHWHRTNYRKDPPTLDARVLRGQKGATKGERLTQASQEWLIAPDFTVFAAVGPEWHEPLAEKIRSGRSAFTPCMGLACFVARLAYIGEEELHPVEASEVITALRLDEAEIDLPRLLEQRRRMVTLSVPRAVDAERRFRSADYAFEFEGQPLPVRRATAFGSSLGAITWM